MTGPATALPPLDPSPEVLHVLEAYLEELEQGGQPQPEELLARHAHLEDPLRACLASLELLHDAAQSLLTGGLVASAAAVAPGLERLGEFRILREVGRGGMGIVYEAEQETLQRRVALKVLPFTAALEAKHLQRFKNEAQAAACLHHQHIVPVYAVGCERGVHYYAMQFIDGRTLASLVEELRRTPGGAGSRTWTGPGSDTAAPAADLAETPAADLTLPAAGRGYFRRIAQWGVQAAEALHHAHGQGIVHRDVKPANLLIDVRGNLWITDFGLARLENEAGGLTRTGDVLGTLRYMSPEQAQVRRGLVDQRTDVYALGATLYELLTLRPAFGGRDRQELLRQITFDEPVRPRRINPAVPPDLETIVLKAMSKEPEGRFATAQDLADDLRRFLEHKPIQARPPSVCERVLKWSRRHRPVVATALALFAVSVVALLVSTALVWREQAQTKAALARLEQQVQVTEAKRLEANVQRRRAETNFHRACAGVTQLLAMLQEPRWSNVPQINELRQAVLQEGLEFFQGYLNETSTDPEVRLQTGRAYLVLASVHGMQGQRRGAEEACAKAIALFEGLVRERPDIALHHNELAFGHNMLGFVLYKAGATAEAAAEFGRAVASYRTGLRHGQEVQGLNNFAWLLATCPDVRFRGPAEAVTLAELAVQMAPRCGNVWNTLGVARYRTGDYKAAIDALERSTRLRAGGDSADWFFLAMAHWRLGDREQADVWYEKALQQVQRNCVVFEPLAAYREEAAAVLGRTGSSRPKEKG